MERLCDSRFRSSGLPPGLGLVKGNITALNSTDNSKIIWNLQTMTGEWVKPGKTPPNGGATAWSGSSLDPDRDCVYTVGKCFTEL
jgi:alcohol dehydrogenase (cytochrome c)